MKLLIPLQSVVALYLLSSGLAGAVQVTVNGGDCGNLQGMTVSDTAVQVTSDGTCGSGGSGASLQAVDDGPTSVGATGSLSALMNNDVYLVNGGAVTMQVRPSGASSAFQSESITTATGGTVSVDAADGSGNRTTISYTAPEAYEGADGFEYRFTQNAVTSTVATVSLSVDSSGSACIVGGSIESCHELPLSTKLDDSLAQNKKDVYHFKINSGDAVQGYSVTVVGIAYGAGTAGHSLYIGISETPGESRFTTGKNPACFDGPTEWPTVTFHTAAVCVIQPGVDYYFTVENVGTGTSGTRTSTNIVN